MAGGLRAPRDDADFSPISALSSVDLPTLGRPTMAMRPERISLIAWPGLFQCAFGGHLFGRPASAPRPSVRIAMLDDTGDP
jgi:hypothetical protein